jgi:Zinc finger, C3HC4 type (RING finger)
VFAEEQEEPSSHEKVPVCTMADIETESSNTHDLETGRGAIDPSDEEEHQSQTPLSHSEEESSSPQKPSPKNTTDENDIIVATPVLDIPWPLAEEKEILDASSRINNEQEETEQRQESSSSKNNTCSICLDAIDATNRAEVTLCRHSFCRSCLVEHCGMCLRQYPIPCPHQLSGCRHNRIPTQQLHDLLSKTQFDDHLKHYWVTKGRPKDSSYSSPVNDFFQCPVCHVLLQGGTSTDFHCVNCRTTSCRRHGREHAGISCEEFRTTDRARAWEQTAQVLETWTKPCSHCGVSLQKAAGCDHVVCLACHQDMCWKVRDGYHVMLGSFLF